MNPFAVSHFFDFQTYPENRWEVIFEEFAECGATHLTVTARIAEQMMGRPAVYKKFRQLGEQYHLKFLDAHGLWGGDQAWDLNVEDLERRPWMLEQHKFCIRLLASLGVKTYTMHIGAQCCVLKRWFGGEDRLRDLACQSLEELLPVAEKEGVIIAIENSFEPSNSPEELLFYLKRFPTPALGVCFDAGHATVMSDDAIPRDPSENEDEYRSRSWHGQLKFQHDALGTLSPHIVTAHLHDNDGHRDQHLLIFDGVSDWKKYMDGLRKCPRLLSIQNEASWGVASISRMCKTFNRLLEL
ncbi:MAG: sugar phosphate isomerase/epimerase [Lentisphaeria bacterium]|nr:sugar phosphate isomerase/epimerase [Lentisphaeria bacterium]